VWVIRGKAVAPAPAKEDFANEIKVLNTQMGRSASRNVLGAVITAADVKDTRSSN
jgi:hypothetical protein